MDSAQAKLMQAGLIGTSIGGWLIDKSHGFGKSAVVMGGAKGGARGAVKVFHPELVELFGREAQLERIRRERSLIGFEHQNLIQILGGGECAQTGYLYVVMEELPWNNLRAELNNVPSSAVRHLITQLANAASALESRGLAHRDIKPENVAVSPDFTKLKLLDLGVLRPFGLSDLTDQNTRPFIGTLRYSSPEYLQRKDDGSVEAWRALTFYQIGAVLHDLLMREELFANESEPFSILVQAVLSAVPSVRGEDVELVRLCKYCLVKPAHIRLQLVSWSSFQFDHNPQASAADDARERIRVRQAYSREIAEQAGVAEGESQRLAKQRLEDACSSLSLRLAVLLADRCFPLRSITQDIDIGGNACQCAIAFECSESLGLPKPIEAQVELTLLDESQGQEIYRLAGRAEIRTSSVPVHLESQIAVGELGFVINDARLETWLLELLEAAYESLDQNGP